MSSGSQPIATQAQTYINDLPDYVKPSYQLLLNAIPGITFDPSYLQDQLPNNTYVPGTPSGGSGLRVPTSYGPTGQTLTPGTPGGIGALMGHPSFVPTYANGQPVTMPSTGEASGLPNPNPGIGHGSMGRMGIISPYPGSTVTVGSGTSGTTVPGGTGYNPGSATVTMPQPVPMLPNGQGAVGAGPGSPSTTPGWGTGRVGPASAPAPWAGGAGMPGGGDYTQGPVFSNFVPGGSNAAIIARAISQSQLSNVDPTSKVAQQAFGVAPIKDPSLIDQVTSLYRDMQSKGMTDQQISGDQSFANLVGKMMGMTVYSTPFLGPYAMPQYTLKSSGGIIGLADGGTFASAFDTTTNPAPSYKPTNISSNPDDPGSGGGYPSNPGDPPNPGDYPGGGTNPGGNLGNGGDGSQGGSGGGTGGVPAPSATLQGSYPFAPYNPYPGQRVLDTTGMFGFDPSNGQPFGLSMPTQFAQNQLVYGYMNPDGTFASAPLGQATGDINATFSGAQAAQQGAAQNAGNLAANPLHSTYEAQNYTVDPYQNFQVQAPGTVRPDLSGFSESNTPQIGTYNAVAYGVNPGNWPDQGIPSAYMDPYTQQVTQQQQNLINQNFDIQQAQQHAAEAAAGTYGGSRQAVNDALSNKYRQQQLDLVAAQNLNNAYNLGMQQFNADRAAQMQAGQYGLQADLSNQQAAQQIALANQQALLGSRNTAAGLDLQAQLANQQAGLGAGEFNANLANQTQNAQVQAMLQAAGLTNQSQLAADQQRQAAFVNQQNALNANLAAQQGLLGIMGSQGPNLGNMQNLQQQLDLQRLQQIQGVGASQDQLRQQMLDLAYQNYTNQQNWPYQLANFYSGILRGVPTAVNSEGFQYQGQNPASWLGLGLAGLGASGGIPGMSGGYTFP